MAENAEWKRMQEEATRKMREMQTMSRYQSSRRQSRGARQEPTVQSVPQKPGNNPGKAEIPTAEPQKPEDSTPAEKIRPENEALQEAGPRKKDDVPLILILILLLSGSDENRELIFALLFLLM